MPLQNMWKMNLKKFWNYGRTASSNKTFLTSKSIQLELLRLVLSFKKRKPNQMFSWRHIRISNAISIAVLKQQNISQPLFVL